MSDSIYLKIYSIYTVTCQIDNMIYVGFSDDPTKRFRKHKQSALHNSQCYLHKSMRKHGIENFVQEIIYQSLDGENCLHEWEPYFIKKYNSFAPSGYNLTLGGEGTLGRICKEETRQKMIGKNNPMHGKCGSLSPRYGIPHSEKSKLLVSKGNAGKIPWNKGKKATEEQKRKLSESAKKRWSKKKQLKP